VELFYHLGTASFKGERLGPAVLNYRRAWLLAPRDPDVAANLRFALQAAGVPEPELTGAESLLTRLSGREWVVAATAGWWATWLFLGLAVLLRARQGLFLRLAAVAGVLAVVALLGVRTWRGFEREPEAVVMAVAQQALHAPLASSTPHFPVPEGSVVRVREFQGDWVMVIVDERAGWIRREVCAHVLPGASVD
jgi:cytochrome c-type biogenesis protein CcmH/NrfG